MFVQSESVHFEWQSLWFFFLVFFPLQSFSLKMHSWPLSTITICQVRKAGFSMWLGNLSGLSTTLPDKYRTKIVRQESNKYAVLCCVCRRRVLCVWRTQMRACCSVQLQLVKLPISTLPAMTKCLVHCQTRHIATMQTSRRDFKAVLLLLWDFLFSYNTSFYINRPYIYDCLTYNIVEETLFLCFMWYIILLG